MRRAISLEEYQAKISKDNGMVRAKVPSPLLRDLGAKPGNYLVFRKTDSGVVVKVKKKKK
jgi:hypothetical protein